MYNDITNHYGPVGVAIVSIFILPNYPHNTRWLSPEERAVAIYRLVEDRGEMTDFEDANIGIWEGFMQAARDYKTWIIAANHIFITTGAGLVVFFPTVVGTLGFSTRKSHKYNILTVGQPVFSV